MKLIKLDYSRKLAIAIKGRSYTEGTYDSICSTRCDIRNICSDPILRRLEVGGSLKIICYDIILSEYKQLNRYSSEMFNKECLGIKYLSLFLYSYARRNRDKIF